MNIIKNLINYSFFLPILKNMMPRITIGGNTIIGENTIIDAYSFVTKDVPKNEIWFGVAANYNRKIKRNNSKIN